MNALQANQDQPQANQAPAQAQGINLYPINYLSANPQRSNINDPNHQLVPYTNWRIDPIKIVKGISLSDEASYHDPNFLKLADTPIHHLTK